MKIHSISHQNRPPGPERKSGFCWKPGETFKYESQWSLLNKFCFWNAIRLSFIRSANEIYRILNLSPLQIAEADGSAYIPPKYNYFENSYLRYCASCMKNQYHSQIFQLLFIEKCPIHKEPLLGRCPSCRDEIPYLAIRKHLHPYTCKCGYPIWSESQRLNKNDVKLTNELIISSFKPTLKWFANRKICKLRRFTESTSFVCDQSISGHVVNYAYFWGEILGEDPPSIFIRNTGYVHQKVLIKEPYKMVQKRRGAPLDHILICGKIYESVKQHITAALCHHDKCIKLAIKQIQWDVMANFTRSLCCVWAQTYILWQMYWEQKCIPAELGNFRSEYAQSEHVYKLYIDRHNSEMRHFYLIRNADLERNLYLFKQFIYSSFWMCAHEVRRRIVEKDYG